MGDGIKVVTPKAEQTEIAKAKTCTPGRSHQDGPEDKGEYCCPFDGVPYKLDADGPRYYWNMVNSGGQPEQGNQSIVLKGGAVCQRWTDTDWPLFFKPSADVIKFVDQWIASGNYGRIARLSNLTTDPIVAKYLLSKSDAVVKAIYETETDTASSQEMRQHTANYTWIFRRVRLQEVVAGKQK